MHMAWPHATAADASSNCSPQLLYLRNWRVSPVSWVTLIAQDFQLLSHLNKTRLSMTRFALLMEEKQPNDSWVFPPSLTFSWPVWKGKKERKKVFALPIFISSFPWLDEFRWFPAQFSSKAAVGREKLLLSDSQLAQGADREIWI